MTPRDILKTYWGYDEFRPLQEEIIQSVLEKHPTLALLPTGGGKSVCFQVPALAMEGICIVVSPLVALMRDQVDQLNRRKIKALALHSGMTRREIDIALDNCVYGEVKFLYVSPERLLSSLFLARTERMNVSMLAIDEAHCISQWGYDFRPPYLQIHEFISRTAIERVIALTATATKEVKKDIIDKLELTGSKVFTQSFARHNLSYSVLQVEHKESKLLEILTNVPGSAVVYVRSRKMTQIVARYLRDQGVSADFYHAGLRGDDRASRQEKWIKGALRVIVATNAFGMGIDKPDVRSVVHLDLPDSLEAYYQEAGRAGRDEKKAYAVLLVNPSDQQRLLDQIERSSVSMKSIRRVYQALANFYKLAVGSRPEKSFAFEMERFAKTYDIPVLEVFNCLKKMQHEGLLALNDGFALSSRVVLLQRKEELYRFQVAHPRLDAVIKALLRLYGGQIFQEFIDLRESDLAKMLNVPLKQVVQWLEMLQQFEVIDYVQHLSGTQITFLQARMDPNDLPIDERQLLARSEIAKQKANAVIDYVERRGRCRTRQLQAYFDEATDEDCGICDDCLARKHQRVSVQPEALYALLREHDPLTAQEIGAMRKDWVMPAIHDAIRSLVDNGLVKVVKDTVHVMQKH